MNCGQMGVGGVRGCERLAVGKTVLERDVLKRLDCGVKCVAHWELREWQKQNHAGVRSTNKAGDASLTTWIA